MVQELRLPPSFQEYSQIFGPYALAFLDEGQLINITSEWPLPLGDKTYLIWWGHQDARVGDWYRFKLPGSPSVQIQSAILILGRPRAVNEISHGHRYFVTFSEKLSAERPLGAVYYAATCHCKKLV